MTSEVPAVSQLIEQGGLRTYFQPIVSVRRKMVAGVEALVRAVLPGDGSVISPKQLFEAASREQLLNALDHAARLNALRTFAARSFDDQLLFLNIDLDAITSEGRMDELLRAVQALAIPPQSIAMELVENQFDDTARLNQVISRVREHGMLVAVDDVGAGHSNLERISLIRPDILKIDRSLCSKLGADHCTEEVFSALVNLGRRIGALVVAEGIETRQQAMVALERGADLLQGFHVLAPQPGETIELDQAAQATKMLAGSFRQHMATQINHHKIERRMHNILLDSMLCDLGQSELNGFASTLARSIRSHPDVECAYVLDQRGQQVTDTIFNVHEFPPSSILFKPAEKGADHSLKTYYNQLLDQEANRYVTEPYVSLASGHLCKTLSATFRDASNERMFVLCIDVKAS